MQFVAAVLSGGSRSFQMGGTNPWVWDKNLLFEKILGENHLKMKEIGPGRRP